MVKKFLYKNRIIVLCLSLLMIFIGIIMGYNYWGVEPQETTAGFLCGLGLGILLIYFALRNN